MIILLYLDVHRTFLSLYSNHTVYKVEKIYRVAKMSVPNECKMLEICQTSGWL